MKKYILSLLLCMPYLEATRQYNLGLQKQDTRKEELSYLANLADCDAEIEVLEEKLQTLSSSDSCYAKVKIDLARAQQNKQQIETMHAVWTRDHESIKFHKKAKSTV